MRKSRSAILEELKISPGDWTIRIEAIEVALREGDDEGARKLVREDPSPDPVPPEIMVRLHTLMTQGVPADSEPEEETRSEEKSQPEQEPSSAEESATPETDSKGDAEPEKERVIEVVAPESREVAPEKDVARPETPIPPWEKRREGGAGALAEFEAQSEESLDGKEASSRMKKREKIEKAPEINYQAAIDRWKNYDGGLKLVDAEYIAPQVSSNSRERLSSLSTALLFHLVLFVLVGLVAVTVPLPKPPQLVVSVVQERDTEIIAPPLTKPAVEIKPAAAAAQSLDVVTSIEGSSFSLPDVDKMENELVAALLPGIQPVGNGMSFVTEATEASQVNFFGVSGGGRKIVFIIDATKKMLVDEKGGMFAYDNVKNEVAAMLVNLNRGTHFNLLLYEGKRLIPFREKLVPGLPSNLRLAIEWLDPLNRDYENLGLVDSWGASIELTEMEEMPLRSPDVAHYTKAIQKSMEWGASTIFCISSGYERMGRSPTPEMRKMMEENPPVPGTPGEFDPAEVKAWKDAVKKTSEWLKKENEARREKGISPKVVLDFNRLVRERTGATPPRRRGGTPSTGGAKLPRLEPVTPETIEDQVKEMVKRSYTKLNMEEPSLYMVLFLGEDERVRDEEDHFRRLTRHNRGKLKILRGLAALEDVTGK